MLSVGSVVGGAFRLIKENPGAVAVWSLVYVASGIATTFGMRSMLDLQAATVDRPDAFAMSDFWSSFGWFFLIQLVVSLLLIVMFTAAMRAVLRPDEGGVAFIRFGMDELRMIGLAVLLAIAFYVGLFVVVLVLGLAFGALMVSGGGTGGVVLVVLVSLLLFAVGVWLYVRLSLAFPLTLLRRRIVIGESWRLTGGRALPLFGAYLVIFLIIVALSIVVSSVSAAPYLAELMRSSGNPEGMVTAAQNQVLQMTEIDARTVHGWVLNGLAGGIMIALLGGAAATAARELTGDELLAREFA